MRKIICFFAAVFAAVILASCAEKSKKNIFENPPVSSMDLEYAEQFSVDYYSDGFAIINIGTAEKYLLVPKEKSVPDNVPDGVTVIKQPVENIYLAASSAMDLFDGINALDSIKATATKEKDWALPNVTAAMENEKILYAGKYSAPDFELIMSEKCGLAIESTMIYHSPAIKEQLEAQGIPVMVERSSYETHPLGRMEWIKLYGLLVGKEREATEFFAEKTAVFREISDRKNTEKAAAFFYIGTNGNVNIRKPGDYISKMIELSGGRYVFTSDILNVSDNDLSTMNIQFEAFYAAAKDADFLIYNSTVDGGITSVKQLIGKNAMLADFKAVQSGNVWCTEKNMFQQTTGAVDMINELHRIFTGDTGCGFEYLYKLD